MTTMILSIRSKGVEPEVWLRMQQAHDVWLLSREMKDELAAIEPLDAA